MPTLSRVFKSLIVFVLAASVASTSVTYTEASCATFDGTSLYANPNDRCTCGTDSDVPAGFVKCPAPGGDPKFALAACSETESSSGGTYTSKCTMECTTDAELSADGKSCKEMNVAPGMEVKEYEGPTYCSNLGYTMLIGKSKGCGCDRPENPKPAGTPCKNAPQNAIDVCRSAGGVGVGVCGFKCKDGYTKTDDGKSCVASRPLEQTGGGNTGGNAGGNNGGNTGGNAALSTCPPFMEFPFAMDDGTCVCSDDETDSGFASTGTLCQPPPAHGKAACVVDNGKSTCGVDCDKPGFKPDASGKTCIPDAVDETFTNSKCGANPPGHFYLTAVPGKGCECRATETTTPGEKWCKAPAKPAKSSCFQSADLSVVECRATNCPKDTVSQGNDCVATVINKDTRECPAGQRYLLASETEGCICSDVVEDGSVVCFAPRSGKGVGRCTSQPDKSDAKCIDKKCDSPATLVKNDCV